MKTVVAIIQARMSSSRLPGKVLRKIPSLGVTPLELLINRLSKAKTPSKIVVATSNETSDDPIEVAAKENGVSIFRGPLHDVLERFCLATEALTPPPEAIVRITADCPFTDPALVDKVVNEFQKSGVDYASNTLELSFPDGFDVEIFKPLPLFQARAESKDPYDREHVTPFIVKNASPFGDKRFRSLCVKSPVNHSDLRVTLDYLEDFNVINHIGEALGANATYDEISTFLRSNPELISMNSATQLRAKS